MKVQSWKSVSTGFETYKLRYYFGDGETAEIVRVTRQDKMIYCVSCMAGCPVGCSFCVSGIRYSRRLSSAEMLDLLYAAWRPTHLPILISMMGSGEPLLNAEEVHKFLRHARAHKYALSTSGVGIQNLPLFTDVPRLKVQISVHAVDDDLRQRIIPGTPPLDEIVRSLKHWPRRRVEWNFVFWKGLNDHEGVAVEIAEWAERNNIHFIKVNAARGDLTPASSRTQDIIKVLRTLGFIVEFYETDGEDIQAGCGQLI